jgi:hypothetical protein
MVSGVYTHIPVSPLEISSGTYILSHTGASLVTGVSRVKYTGYVTEIFDINRNPILVTPQELYLLAIDDVYVTSGTQRVIGTASDIASKTLQKYKSTSLPTSGGLYFIGSDALKYLITTPFDTMYKITYESGYVVPIGRTIIDYMHGRYASILYTSGASTFVVGGFVVSG